MADGNAYDANHRSRHKEGTAQNGAEANEFGVAVPVSHERGDAGEEVGRAISKRKESEACYGRRKFQGSGHALQGRGEVSGSSVGEEVEEDEEPEEKGEAQKKKRGRAIEEADTGYDGFFWGTAAAGPEIGALGLVVMEVVKLCAPIHSVIISIWFWN